MQGLNYNIDIILDLLLSYLTISEISSNQINDCRETKMFKMYVVCTIKQAFFQKEKQKALCFAKANPIQFRLEYLKKSRKFSVLFFLLFNFFHQKTLGCRVELNYLYDRGQWDWVGRTVLHMFANPNC